MKKQKVVLAYSGGLDTSVIIPWLIENYGLEVHALAGDVGQGPDELEGLEKKARATGAASCKVVDLRREFLTDYVWPCLRAMAVYEGRYLLGTSMARPVLAKAQVEHALAIGATHLAHGCTGKGNDQVRFELTYYALEPGIRVIAPWRIWDLTSRSTLIAYAEQKGIPVPVTREKPYSTDRNLLHISYEGGILEDPWREPYEDMFVLSVAPEKAPDKAEYVEIDRPGQPDRLLELGRALALLAVGVRRQDGGHRRGPRGVQRLAVALGVSVELAMFAQISPLPRPCPRRTAAPA